MEDWVGAVIFFVVVYIIIQAMFSVIYLMEVGNEPFTPKLFYDKWKVNWVGAVIFCILAYIIFPVWGIWSLLNIGRKK